MARTDSLIAATGVTMRISPRPWSESTFLEVLADQALLYRVHRGDIDRGWPDEATRLAVIERDWYWMAGIMPLFIEALLNESARTEQPIHIHTSNFGGHEMQNILHKVQAPLFAEHFINWTASAATGALCFSPHFNEPQLLNYRRSTFRLSRTQYNETQIERLPAPVSAQNSR